jgi:hypothetical protein
LSHMQMTHCGQLQRKTLMINIHCKLRNQREQLTGTQLRKQGCCCSPLPLGSSVGVAFMASASVIVLLTVMFFGRMSSSLHSWRSTRVLPGAHTSSRTGPAKSTTISSRCLYRNRAISDSRNPSILKYFGKRWSLCFSPPSAI